MSKFFGTIGYSISEETAPGVWMDNIVEHNHYGDVNRSKAQHETEVQYPRLILTVGGVYNEQTT